MKLGKLKIQPKGNSYDGSTEYVEKKNHTLIIIAIFIILIIVISLIVYNVSRSSKCNNIEKMILEQSMLYAENNDLLPTVEGESVTLNIDDVFLEETLKPTLEEKICSGTVKITKYKEEYIKTYDITNCNYCTTDERYKKWSKEVSKKPSNRYVIDVIPYYNYYEISYYHSAWSSWIPEEEIGEVNETYQVALPLKESVLPKISSEANIIEYEKDDATWYSYRDKKWRYYRDNGGSYSELSSEQPAGFANKDTSTQMLTAWTEWSLDYPEKKDYRTINSKNGYRWYYLDGNEKVYWNSGAYYPTQPSEEFNKKEKEYVKMYRYQDKMWKWYNGKKRSYSGFMSSPTNSYKLRDNDIFEYSNWSRYSAENKIDSSNSSYREQQTKTYSRYRISYSMKSFLKLDSYVGKTEFERILQGTVPELITRTDISVDIDYKFIYRKK